MGTAFIRMQRSLCSEIPTTSNTSHTQHATATRDYHETSRGCKWTQKLAITRAFKQRAAKNSKACRSRYHGEWAVFSATWIAAWVASTTSRFSHWVSTHCCILARKLLCTWNV